MRRALLYIFLILLCLSTSARAALVYSSDFNVMDWNKHGGCYPYSYQIVDDPCDANDNVLQVTMRIGDDTGACTNTWKDANGGCNNGPCFAWKHRTEAAPPFNQNSPIRQSINQEFWFGWRVYIPANFPTVRLPGWIVTQSIPVQNDGVDFALNITANGTWSVTSRRTAQDAVRNDDILDLGAIQRGQWTNFVFRFLRRQDNQGVHTLWKNNVQVYNRTGVTTQNAVAGNIWKFGMYRGQGIPTAWGGDQHVLLFDDVKIAVGVNQKNVVDTLDQPWGTCPVPTPPVAFQEDWETGGINFAKWRKDGGCHDHSLNVVDDPCDAGNKVLRMRSVMGSDTQPCNDAFDVAATGAGPTTFPNTHRVELEPLPTTLRVLDGADHIVGFRMLIPAAWPTVQPVTQQIFQYLSPPFNGGPDIIASIGDYLTGTRDRRVYVKTRNAAVATYVSTDLGPLTTSALKQGVWNAVEHHFKRATDGTGREQLWVNGQRVLNYTGRTSISADNTAEGARFKFGMLVERAVELAKLGETYDLYIDDIKIADSTDPTLVRATAPPGECLNEPPPPPTDTNVIANIGVREEACEQVAHPKTNGLVVVPDNATLETAIETNINKTILVKAGTYPVTNFEVGDGNVVKPFDCQTVIVQPADDTIITASNWVIAGLRFDCHEGTDPLGADACIKVTNLASNWWFRNNEMAAAKKALHIAGNTSNGRVNGNMFEGAATTALGDLVEIGDVSITGPCTVLPCRGQLSPSNILFTDNWLTGNRTGRTSAAGGGSMLLFNGVNAAGVEANNNLFTRIDDFKRPITINNSVGAGAIDVCRNTMAGPFFGLSNNTQSTGPGILIDDTAATADRSDCRTVGDCPNHQIHHNYCEQCYAVDPGTDTSQQSGAAWWGDNGYSSGTIDFNIDNNRRGFANQRNAGAKVDKGVYRHNSHYQGSFRLQSGTAVCSDVTASGETLSLINNVFNFTEVDDECAGTPDWLVDGNVFSEITGPGIAVGHLDTGNVTASIAYANHDFEWSTTPPVVPDLSVTSNTHQSKGALPTPTYVSGAINDSCVLTATMAAYDTLYDHGALHNLNISKIQIEYNDVAQTINSGSIQNGVVTLQMAACPNIGAVVQFNATHGWCQDSANVGGFFAPGCGLMASCPTLSNQSITNNTTGGPATIAQANHQFFRRFPLPDAVLPLAAENESIPVYDRSRFDLRFGVRVNEGQGAATARDFGFELWARKNGGSWVEVTTNASATVGVYIVDNPNRASRATLTNRLPLGGTSFATGGKYIDSDNDDNTLAINNNQQGELEWSLSTNTNCGTGCTVELQVRGAGGVVLNSYNSTATITGRSVRGTKEGG